MTCGGWSISSELLETERAIAGHALADIPAALWMRAKREGFGDAYLARLLAQKGVDGQPASLVRARRLKRKAAQAGYYLVDTCAAEFESNTPYMYSHYDGYDESAELVAQGAKKDKIMILGGGPNRIGQGIEFDYCCVHACYALRDLGFETIMVNCNPETVSTDYDTADRLYFEPLTLEDVLNIWECESGRQLAAQPGPDVSCSLAGKRR